MYGRRSVIASGTPDFPTCCSSIAVPNHAASIWLRSIPASFRPSSNASTMRSSAFWSQRSPNFEQPMPRTTTLSRIPVAIADSFRRARSGRRSLPKVSHEAPCRIVFLDAEHHAHRHADLDLAVVDVGEVGHHPAAAFELHHPVVMRR